MIYAIFDEDFVEVKSMYKKSQGGAPQYYSIYVHATNDEHYIKNYDSEGHRDKAWDFILKTIVQKKQRDGDVFVDFTTDSHFTSTLEEE